MFEKLTDYELETLKLALGDMTKAGRYRDGYTRRAHTASLIVALSKEQASRGDNT